MLVSVVENKRVAEMLRTQAVPVWIPVTEIGFPNVPGLAKMEEGYVRTSFNRTAFANYAVVAEGGRVLGVPDCREYDYTRPMSLQGSMVEMLGRQLDAVREARHAHGKGIQALEARAKETMSWCSDPAYVTLLAMAGHTPVKFDQQVQHVAANELAPAAKIAFVRSLGRLLEPEPIPLSPNIRAGLDEYVTKLDGGKNKLENSQPTAPSGLPFLFVDRAAKGLRKVVYPASAEWPQEGPALHKAARSWWLAHKNDAALAIPRAGAAAEVYGFWRAVVPAVARGTGKEGIDFSLIPRMQEMKNRPLAPDFTLANADGKKLSLKDFRGKVVFLNFWATWCETCREEMPSMERLYREFRTKGLEVVAVNVQDKQPDALALAKELKLSYPILMDSKGETGQSYGAFGLPASYLIDRNGVMVARLWGPADWHSSGARQLIAALVKQK
jgi:peroxiredoxin